MFKVLKKDELSPGVFRFDVEAPRLAKKTRPGQFIILRVNEEGERVPAGSVTFHVGLNQPDPLSVRLTGQQPVVL